LEKKQITTALIRKKRENKEESTVISTRIEDYKFNCPEDTINFIEHKKLFINKLGQNTNEYKATSNTNESIYNDIKKFNEWKLRITTKEKYKSRYHKATVMTQPSNYYAALAASKDDDDELEENYEEEEQTPMTSLIENAKKIPPSRKFNIQADEETSWETVGARQTQREHKLAHEYKSGRYLPFTLPYYDNDDMNTTNTNIVLPLTIKISPPKQEQDSNTKTHGY
jgi:hypothetical protein